MKRKRRKHYSIMVIPHENSRVRTFRVSYLTVRLLICALLCCVAGAAILIVNQKKLVSMAAKTSQLEMENEELMQKSALILELAERMDRFEELYKQIGEMFGTDLKLSEEARDGTWKPTVGPFERATRIVNETGKVIPGTFSRDGSRAEECSRPSSWPVSLRGYITRQFSMATEKHKGIDIAVPRNTPVKATADGVVAEARYDPIYGNYVVIEHGNGFSTLYAHNSRLCVSTGQNVKKDDVIAFTGSSGTSTAPHLHYELRKNNVPIDPQPFLR